jgi:RHS repeat-associated protein
VQPAISLIGEGSGSGGTATASVTVNFPTGYQVGDQIFVASTQSDTTVVAAPSTYTLVTSATSGGTAPKAGTDLYRHTIASGEASVTISYTGTSSVKAVLLADYRGVDSTLPVDVFSSATTAGGTTVVAPSVSPAYASDRLLIFQGARGTFSSKSWTAPTGTTEQVQMNSQANVSAGLADLALAATGATGTKTSTFGASANLTTIIVAIPQPPSVLFDQTDQIGSTRLLTDSAGVVRGTFSYDAFGNLIGSTGSFSTPLGYTGSYRDSESGLTYLIGRYYDPTTGQFLTRDPMVITTRDPYGYVGDNPLNRTDPRGLCDFWDVVCAVQGVISTVTNVVSDVNQGLAEGAPLYQLAESTNCGSDQICQGFWQLPTNPALVASVAAIATVFVPGVGEVAAFAGALSVANDFRVACSLNGNSSPLEQDVVETGGEKIADKLGFGGIYRDGEAAFGLLGDFL